MILKGVERLDSFITNFIYQLGYDEVSCFLDTDFAYWGSSKEIGYSLFESETSNLGFIKFIRKNYFHIPQCSLFTFSLLHELGHYLTLDKFSTEEKEAYYDEIEDYLIDSNDTKEEIMEKQIKYSSTLIEKTATDTAMDILKTYHSLVMDFERELKKELGKFYKLNGVEISIEEI